jgi:heme a synthase
MKARPSTTPLASPRLQRFGWIVLAANLGVVLWGAFVRASGSGAGCGSHWPLCNDVLVRSPRIETIIEFSHRLSSGLALVLVFGMTAWALRARPSGDPARRSAIAAAVFIVSEALIGAGLVLWRLVAKDASVGRALSVSLHLTNTFFLLASVALTAYFAHGGRVVRLRRQGVLPWLLAVPLGGILVVGTTGAVAALGDTLFPARSLAEGFSQDWSSTAHLFVRLRALHPLFAVLTAAAAVASVAIVRALRPSPTLRRMGAAVIVAVSGQVGLGLLNLVLLAPIWMQLAHLFAADAVWVVLVLFAAAALQEMPAAATSRREVVGEAAPGEAQTRSA